MIVCLCRNVTDAKIRRALAEGACSVEQVAACTRAGTDCGACKPYVAKMVDSESHSAPRPDSLEEAA